MSIKGIAIHAHSYSITLDITYDLEFILSCEPTITVLLGKLCVAEGKDFDATSHRLRQEVEKLVEAKAVQVVEESYLAQLKYARLVA